MYTPPYICGKCEEPLDDKAIKHYEHTKRLRKPICTKCYEDSVRHPTPGNTFGSRQVDPGFQRRQYHGRSEDENHDEIDPSYWYEEH